MTDFIKSSIAYGCVYNEFEDLPEKTKKKLTRIMARLAERSYRRGFQQGVFLSREGRQIVDLYHFRYQTSLDAAPMTDGGYIDSATNRLFMENGVLCDLGFPDPHLEYKGKEIRKFEVLRPGQKDKGFPVIGANRFG
jgi:hypothetical protein